VRIQKAEESDLTTIECGQGSLELEKKEKRQHRVMEVMPPKYLEYMVQIKSRPLKWVAEFNGCIDPIITRLIFVIKAAALL